MVHSSSPGEVEEWTRELRLIISTMQNSRCKFDWETNMAAQWQSRYTCSPIVNSGEWQAEAVCPSNSTKMDATQSYLVSWNLTLKTWRSRCSTIISERGVKTISILCFNYIKVIHYLLLWLFCLVSIKYGIILFIFKGPKIEISVNISSKTISL
jgi:hypothetical protein